MSTTLGTGLDGGRSDDARTAAARTAGVVSLLVLAVGLGGLAVGVDWAWIAFPLGYGGVLPLAIARARARARRGASAGPSGAVQSADADESLVTLRERYARGEVDDAEFERRVERLVETEGGIDR